MRAFKTQHEKVDTFIRGIGGYWPPLGALARVTEELGEFAEAVAANDVGAEVEEITDLFVIVSTITNQYCAWPTIEQVDRASEEIADLCTLARACGSLARLVNQFEGIKPPKNGEQTADITAVIARIYALLSRMAKERGAALPDTVLASTDAKGARDAERFAVKSFDPITARALDALRTESAAPVAQWAADARLWGEPSMIETPAFQLDALRLFHSERFLRVSRHHRLDGYVGVEEAGTSHADNVARCNNRLAFWNGATPGAEITGLGCVTNGRLFTVMRLANANEPPPSGAFFPVPR